MIPTSVLGWSKVGGGGNTLSYFTVLTSLFASALLIKLLRQSFSKNLVNIILSALLIFGFSSYYYKTNFVDHEYKLVLSILSGEQKSNRRVVYDIYNKEPNKIYFPNYGLEQYLATKKLLPLADVLQSFRLARYNIEDDVIIEHFKDLDYIVIGVAEPGYETIKHYLQEINELEDIKLVDQRR